MTREEEARLYQQSGKIDYGLKPVLGAETTILDHRRLRNYFENVLLWGGIDDLESREGRTQLVNLGLATRTHRRTAPTVNGVLLFGRNAKRFVPQSGIRAICYAGQERDYATRADEVLGGPLVPLRDRVGSLVEPGLVESGMGFRPTEHFAVGSL